jgi:hypothetical protein
MLVRICRCPPDVLRLSSYVRVGVRRPSRQGQRLHLRLVLDACFEQDPASRVACETLVKNDTVVLAGEITTNAKLDYDAIVRQAVKEIGYTDTTEPFCDTTLKLISILTKQSNEISQGVTSADQPERRPGRRRPGHHVRLRDDETPELMPLPILLAHRLTPRCWPSTARPASRLAPPRLASRRSRCSTTATAPSRSPTSSSRRSTRRRPTRRRSREYVARTSARGARRLVAHGHHAHREPDRQLRARRARRPTPASPAARSSSTPTAAWAATAAARSAARTRRRSTAAAPTSAATSPAGGARRARPKRPRSRWATRSAWPAGLGQGRHVRHGRRARRRRVRDELRLPPARHHRAARPAAPDLPLRPPTTATSASPACRGTRRCTGTNDTAPPCRARSRAARTRPPPGV